MKFFSLTSHEQTQWSRKVTTGFMRPLDTYLDTTGAVLGVLCVESGFRGGPKSPNYHSCKDTLSSLVVLGVETRPCL